MYGPPVIVTAQSGTNSVIVCVVSRCRSAATVIMRLAAVGTLSPKLRTQGSSGTPFLRSSEGAGGDRYCPVVILRGIQGYLVISPGGWAVCDGNETVACN